MTMISKEGVVRIKLKHVECSGRYKVRAQWPLPVTSSGPADHKVSAR